MPLRNAIQLIVQVERAGGGFHCEALTGLPLLNPIYIAFCSTGSPQAARHKDRLVASFRRELQVVAGGRSVPPPCGGSAMLGCHALTEPDCQKLLVIVGDAGGQVPALSLLDLWGHDPSFSILPVFPTAAKPALRALPAGVRQQNAALWDGDVEQALPAIFSASGITPEQPRIFISYRQSDSAALAMRLFDALSHDRFDVFLDHFRIAPGVNFQSRLRQELGDKSMVLLIESENLGDSEWVLYEINEAKACGLGICAVNVGDAPEVDGVDEAVRLRLSVADFENGTVGGELKLAALGRVVDDVRREHDRALLRRRIALEQSFALAVRRAGGPPPVREPNGAFRISHPGKDYLAWLTTRPPDLPDFHYVHGAATKPTIGVIIGLSRLMEPLRAARVDWLAGLCDLKLLDEGRLVWAAGEISRGTL